MKIITFLTVGLFLTLNVNAETSAQPSADPSVACIDNLSTNPRLQSLFEKMPLDITKGQPLGVLGSNAKASSKEKSALSLFTAEQEKCFALGSEWRQKNYLPSIVNLLEKFRTDELSVFADIYAGNVTFGGAAKSRAKLVTEFNGNVNAIIYEAQMLQEASEKQRLATESKEREQKIARDLDMQLQLEREQRQEQFARQQQLDNRRNALLPYLMQPYQPYQVPAYQMPIQRQQNTNCTVNGNQMNCTTR